MNRDRPDRPSGFSEVYLVTVRMSENCARSFFADLEKESRDGERCPDTAGCSVRTRRGFSITAVKENGEYTIASVG